MKKILIILIPVVFYFSCDNRLDWVKKKDNLPTPIVTKLSPATGNAGSTVIITGNNFSTLPINNIVTFFNGTTATVIEATSTRLTVTVPETGTTGPVIVTVLGKTAVNHPIFTYGPTVTELTPAAGLANATIVIKGSNFSTVPAHNTVTFNGTPATVTAATATQLTVTVPTTGTTGPVVVMANTLRATNQPVFTYQQAAGPDGPIVTTLNIQSGFAGETVVITGSNFSSVLADNTVTFNGTTASVVAATTTKLTVTVPAGGSTGVVSVTVNGQTAINQPVFTYGPVVINLSPTTGLVDETIKITGTNFSTVPANNIVTFNSTPAIVTAATETELTVTVPATGTTGPVVVKVINLTAANSPVFTYQQPLIVSEISPTSGPNGTSITISGQGFSTTSGDNIVKINGVIATVTSATATTLIVNAPDIIHDYDHACPVAAAVQVSINGQKNDSPPIFTYQNSSPSTIFAGSLNNLGFADGNSTTAQFNRHLQQLTIDNNGNIIVNDFFNNALRKIDPNGNVSTIMTGFTAWGMDFDNAGNVYACGASGVLKITPDGTRTTINNNNWTITQGALIWNINTIAVDNATGNLYLTDAENQRIVRVTPDGSVTPIAGSGVAGTVDGQGTNAQFNFFTSQQINSLIYDGHQNLYILERGTTLRKITLSGMVTTINTNFLGAYHLATDPQGNVYVSETGKPCKLQPDGSCCTISNQNLPADNYFDVDSKGNTYISGLNNGVIYKITN